jgi:tetratricopeptide (TPR) repeat protein
MNTDAIKKLVFLFILLFLPVLTFADTAGVFRENSQSIVVVTAYNSKGQPLTEGTGFIASPDGAIITNYHVIGIAKDIKVRASGRIMNVEGVIYSDINNDIAILKVKGSNMPSVSFGNTDKLDPKEKVYIISSSVDSGNMIYEGKFRRTRTISRGTRLIEITAPVSHGSSGSPLFNANGEVIGIATFLTKRTENIISATSSEFFRDKWKSNKLIAIKDIIKNYRNTAEYWFYLGYYLYEAGAYKEAANVLKEAIRLKPGFAEAYYYRGIVYEKLGRDKEAAKSYRDAIKSRSDFTDAYFSLGVIYGKLGMYKESLEALNHAVSIEPDFSDAYYNMGVAYEKLNMFKEGIEAGKKAVGLKPDFTDAYYNLGIAYEKTGSYNKAIEAFQTVLKIRHDYAEAHYNLGIVYFLLKDKVAAMERYQILKNINKELANKLFKLIY